MSASPSPVDRAECGPFFWVEVQSCLPAFLCFAAKYDEDHR